MKLVLNNVVVLEFDTILDNDGNVIAKDVAGELHFTKNVTFADGSYPGSAKGISVGFEGIQLRDGQGNSTTIYNNAQQQDVDVFLPGSTGVLNTSN